MQVLPSPDELLARLKKLGINSAEVYSSGATTLSVEYSAKTCKTKEISHDFGYGVRVLKNNKIGFSHTNISGDFDKTAKTAHTLSKISPKTNFSFEPKARKYPSTPTYDSAVAELDPEMAFLAIEQILAGVGKKAEPTKISISLSKAKEEIANTENLYTNAEYTEVSLYVEAKKGNGLGFSLYSARDMPKDLEKFGVEAAKVANQMKSSKPIPTQELTVKFLVFNFDGDNKRRGITKLKTGQSKFDSKFSLISDPLSAGDAACSFDGEGAPSKALPLITEGKVKNFLYDRYTGALEGIKKDGCCQRTDYASYPSPGITNLVIPAGRGGTKPEKYLEIISAHGLHTSDPVSGDFGVDVDIALLHNKGKITPVSNVLLSGNIFNLFNSIKHLGKTQLVHGNLISPEIWFSKVHIIGKNGEGK